MTPDYVQHIGTIARALFGEPNKRLSKKGELRFGTHGSLSVDLTAGTWFDFEANEGGGARDLIQREKHLTGEEATAWMREIGCDLEDHPEANGHREETRLGRIVATYSYTAVDGAESYQVLRYDPKDFRQRRRPRPDDPPDKIKGGFVYSIAGVRPLPYRLPQLIEAIANETMVFIVEGEKDADNMADRLGIPATTNSGGAGKWREELDDYFNDADVVIIVDNDPQATNKKTGELLFHPDGRPRFPGQDHGHAVAARLMSRARRLRLLDLGKRWRECPPKGDISDWIAAGGTAEALYEIVEKLPDWTSEQQKPRRFEPISTFRDPATIPPRRFLYGRHYIKGCMSATIADGGIGKTNLAIAEGIAMSLGRNILGIDVPEPQRVCYWNGEESLDEIERRVHAVCLHHTIDPSELAGKFFMMSGLDVPIMVAHMHQGALVFDEAGIAAIVEMVTRLGLGVLTLDPFVSLHRIPENDNTNIEAVAARLLAVAHHQQIAVEIDHHIRKPHANGGDTSVADARGAGALINKARVARVLNRMTAAQAKTAKVADHREYFRADNGKANYAPVFAATWFKINSVPLPNGDDVGAIEAWKYPGAFDAVRPEHIEKVQAMMRSNDNYRADDQSPDWVGRLIAEVVELDADDDRALIKKIIKTWVDNKVLYKVERKDERRRQKVFITADPPDADNVVHVDFGSFLAVTVGPAPTGVPCVQCQSTEGDIFKIKDGRVKNGKAEVLHEGCAEAWFQGEV